MRCSIISRVVCATPFPRVAEHKYSAIGKHLTEVHGGCDLLNESRFKILN